MTADLNGAAHNEVTLNLAKKESVEHLHGMIDLREVMSGRTLQIDAFALDDPDAPSNDGGETVKTVHFVRHGQGFHNLMADIATAQGKEWIQFTKTPENPYVMPEILDAPLTDKGRQQARLLQPTIKSFPNQPQLVILSPNCRALQTGLISFEHLIPTVPFIAHEMVREENGVHVCDKRRPTSQQAKEFPQVDFSLLQDETDVIFSDHRRETKLQVGERIYKFMDWLASRPDEHIAVASHSGWLLTVFNGVCKCDADLKRWFHTGEMRSVKLKFTTAKL